MKKRWGSWWFRTKLLGASETTGVICAHKEQRDTTCAAEMCSLAEGVVDT